MAFLPSLCTVWLPSSDGMSVMHLQSFNARFMLFSSNPSGSRLSMYRWSSDLDRLRKAEKMLRPVVM